MTVVGKDCYLELSDIFCNKKIKKSHNPYIMLALYYNIIWLSNSKLKYQMSKYVI